VELSLFAQRFGGDSGVVDLMRDLGEALTIHPDMIMMGGGNPGRVPAAERLYRERLRAILDDPALAHAMLGVYQPPQGDERFRAALARMLREECGWAVGAENIAVANGSQSAFFVLFNLFAGEFAGGRRRHVLLPLVPEYIGYREVGLGDDMFRAGRPAIERLPEQLFKYRVDFAQLAPGDDTGAICVSRPTNPTGNVLGDAEIARLDALARARGKAAFGDNCAPCHGSGGTGAKGYPNLNDDDWLWGGTLEQIMQTIEFGVRSGHGKAHEGNMLAFGKDGMLKKDEIVTVANYVRSLSGLSTRTGADLGAGEKLFADNCASCHGPDGKGMHEMGAPNLTDRIWLYGGTKAAIAQTIAYSRAGVMPAWGGRLDPAMINMLTVYVHALGGGE